MAEFGINIDSVYQTVQGLANKEQRGFITPQDFNLFANQAQLDIFEQYFYDLNAQIAERPENREIGDAVTLIRNKLKPWTQTTSTTGNLPPGARSGRVYTGSGIGTDKGITPIPMDPIEYHDIIRSKWHKDGFSEPVTWNVENEKIVLADGSGVIGGTVEYVEGRPNLVYWGYVVVNEKAMYDPSTSQHFQLHKSEQPDIVVKILELAGVAIEDGQLIQYANAEEQANKADERI